MGLAFVLVSSVIVISIIRWYFRRCNFIKHLEIFPGPPPLPLVGNALDLKSTTEMLPKFLEYGKKYGDIVKIHIGPTPSMLLITDYNLIEFILSSPKIIQKAQEYRFMANWLGDGLILSTGDKWRKHRKIITPTFHFKILEEFIGIFNTNANVLVKKLKKAVSEKSVDIYPLLKLCTLDIICESAMGTSINAQEDSESEYVRGVQATCQIMIYRMFNPLLQPDWLYHFSKHYQVEKKALQVIHDYSSSVIRRRKLELQSQNQNNQKDAKRKLAFLDLLLKENEINETLSDVDLREEVDNFMFAGHDTTSSAMSFALYCLAENPDVQKKVIEELQGIFADDKFRPPTLQDLQNMRYLEMVIKESLRIYPAVPFFSRNIHEDTEYAGGILPKGVTLVFHVYGVHRNPKLYAEPEKFIPERFTVENAADRLPFAYIPFSAGPRNCIGFRYAMLEMKAVLSSTLRHFKIRPTTPKHHLVLSAESILVSENGVCIRLEERDF